MYRVCLGNCIVQRVSSEWNIVIKQVSVVVTLEGSQLRYAKDVGKVNKIYKWKVNFEEQDNEKKSRNILYEQNRVSSMLYYMWQIFH